MWHDFGGPRFYEVTDYELALYFVQYYPLHVHTCQVVCTPQTKCLGMKISIEDSLQEEYLHSSIPISF